jgi:hypothetical protein
VPAVRAHVAPPKSSTERQTAQVIFCGSATSAR